MKEIKLTQGKFAIVDDDMFEYLNQWKWCYDGQYACRRKNGVKIRLHKEIMGDIKDKEIDHINENKLDNRKDNLRFCTRAENMRNKKKHRGISKYKGVHWCKNVNKWRAKIYNGKTIHLGLSNNQEECARMYDAKAKELFGEFANLNFA